MNTLLDDVDFYEFARQLDHDYEVIPPRYFHASDEQRLAMLQGFMDADGETLAQGFYELCCCHDFLRRQIVVLLRSLGIEAVNDGNRVTFNTPARVFRYCG